jgi:2,3-dihydroxy-p-cumate/2,3-dihydroxybenzoate 3,4-dioxygenase
MRLRAVELKTVDLPKAAQFLEQTWGLVDAGKRGATRYWRGTGEHPYILSLTAAKTPGVEAITFAGSPEEISEMTGEKVAAFDAPGGGSGVIVEGPEGQRYRFVTDARTDTLPADRNRPIELSHAVLNATDVEKSERFAVEVLGFRVSDRTRFMRFVRCNRKHHALAFAQAEFSSLNHIAFEMRDIDAVMNGIGRLREAGHACAWGPGRHGPGNNVFGYFVAPFGPVIEYTAELGEVGEDYRVGGPEDWKWPAGRTDHWGISTRDSARMAQAERAMPWANSGPGS